MRRIKRVCCASTSEPFCSRACEHLAQRRVHEVRGGMVPHRAPPRPLVHLRVHRVADAKHAGALLAVMAEHLGLDLLRIVDRERAGGTGQLAAIADLPSRLGVNGVVEHHYARIARAQLLRRRAFAVKRYTRPQRQRVLAVELVLSPGIRARWPWRNAKRRGPLALCSMPPRIRHVDAPRALAADIAVRSTEPVPVVEAEYRVAVEQLSPEASADSSTAMPFSASRDSAPFLPQDLLDFVLRRPQPDSASPIALSRCRRAGKNGSSGRACSRAGWHAG